MHEKDLQIYYGWSCLPCQNDADGKLVTDSSPTTIRKAIEGSLNRLNTDQLDLYYQQSARLQNAGGGGS
jgi:aryl-alcohol dehydrogenase-like predicted oxidoreductase